MGVAQRAIDAERESCGFMVPDSLIAEMVTRSQEIKDGTASQIPIPFRVLKEHSGHGLRRGCVTVLAGPPGNGKTYMALHMGQAAGIGKMRWCYWPFEDEALDYFERYLALEFNDWGLAGGTPEAAEARSKLLTGGEKSQRVVNAEKCFLQNPYLPYQENGEYILPKPNSHRILCRLLEMADEYDLILLDPISGIKFTEPGKAFWEAQDDFMSDLSNCMKGRRAHIILVAHTRKAQQYGKKKAELDLDSIQGAAAFQRFAQYVYLLDYSNEPKESDVETLHGVRKEVTHRRTLFIAKTRYAKGAGTRIAFDFSNQGPELREYGRILRNGD